MFPHRLLIIIISNFYVSFSSFYITHLLAIRHIKDTAGPNLFNNPGQPITIDVALSNPPSDWLILHAYFYTNTIKHKIQIIDTK